jgi:hypothetical protein
MNIIYTENTKYTQVEMVFVIVDFNLSRDRRYIKRKWHTLEYNI